MFGFLMVLGFTAIPLTAAFFYVRAIRRENADSNNTPPAPDDDQ